MTRRSLRSEPDRVAPHRQRARRGRQPRLRRRMLLRIDDTDPGAQRPGRRGGDPRGSRAGSASSGTKGRCGRASGRSAIARPPPGSAQRFQGVTLLRERRHRDLPAGERRRRHRLRDHPRRSAATTTGRTRSCTGGLHERARRRAARVRPLRARPRRRTERSSRSAPRARRSHRCARRASRRGRARATSRSSASRSTTCTSTCRGSARSRSRRSAR